MVRTKTLTQKDAHSGHGEHANQTQPMAPGQLPTEQGSWQLQAQKNPLSERGR